MRTALVSDDVVIAYLQLRRLKPERQKQLMSLRALGRFSGVRFQQLSEIERGMRVTVTQARAIAGALRVPLSKLT